MKKVSKIITIIIAIYIISSLMFSNIAYGIIFYRHDNNSNITLQDNLAGYSFNIDKINGKYYSSENPDALIILCEGLYTSYLNYLPEITYFINNNYDVVAFDYQGVGLSYGNSSISLSQSVLDLQSVVDYFNSMTQLDIVLYGHSLSGYAVSVLSDNEKVSCVISISGFDKPVDIMYEYGKKYAGVFAKLQYPFLVLEDYFVNKQFSNQSAYQHLLNSKIPVLIISGENDEVIPESCSLYHKEYPNENITKYLIQEQGCDGHSYYCYTSQSALYSSQINNLYQQCQKDDNQKSLDDLFINIEYQNLYQINPDYFELIDSFIKKN